MDASRFSVAATIRDIVSGWDFPDSHSSQLYVFTGLDRCLYTGISCNPIVRIHQHLGIGGGLACESQIGRIVRAFKPQSLDWLVYFPSGKELIDCLQEAEPYSSSDLVDWSAIRLRMEREGAMSVSKLAESVLIRELQCPVNSTYACEGVDFKSFWDVVNERLWDGSSTSDYLNL